MTFIIINAIITFNNHFNHAFTLSDLSELAIILNQYITIITIAAINAKAFIKDKTIKSNDSLFQYIFVAKPSVHCIFHIFNTADNIHTHQKNNREPSIIYNIDDNAGFTLSSLDQFTNNLIQDITRNKTTKAYHKYLMTCQSCHP